MTRGLIWGHAVHYATAPVRFPWLGSVAVWEYGKALVVGGAEGPAVGQWRLTAPYLGRPGRGAEGPAMGFNSRSGKQLPDCFLAIFGLGQWRLTAAPCLGDAARRVVSDVQPKMQKF